MYDKFILEKLDFIDDEIVKEFLCSFYEKNKNIWKGVNFYFVEIFGKRWSYVCGFNSDISARPLRIVISKKFGICFHSNKLLNINDDAVQKILNLLKEKVLSLKI